MTISSILIVTSPASSYDLTTLEMVKLEFGIDAGDDSQDMKLTGWIHQASSTIANVCKRVFVEEILSESFRKVECGVNGGLILTRRPIISITSITENDIALLTTEYEIDYKAGIVYRLHSTDLISRSHWNFSNRIIVIYTAGYILIPYDVERACVLLVKYFKIQDGDRGGDFNVKMIEVPGVLRQEWGVNANVSNSSKYDLPSNVMMLLNPYVEKIIR